MPLSEQEVIYANIYFSLSILLIALTENTIYKDNKT